MTPRLVRLETPEGEPVVVATDQVVLLRHAADAEGAPATLIFTTCAVASAAMVRVRGTVGRVADQLAGHQPRREPPAPYDTTVRPGRGEEEYRVRVCGPCRRPLDCYELGSCARGTGEYEYGGIARELSQASQEGT